MLLFHNELVIRENIIVKILFTSCSAKISYCKNFHVYGICFQDIEYETGLPYKIKIHQLFIYVNDLEIQYTVNLIYTCARSLKFPYYKPTPTKITE